MANTASGRTFAKNIAGIFQRYGYEVVVEENFQINSKRGCKIDLTAIKNNVKYDIECKFQESEGSTYEKLPQAFRRLRKLTKLRNNQPVIVYGGSKLVEKISNDYFMEDLQSEYPDVPMMHFGEMVLNLERKGTPV